MVVYDRLWREEDKEAYNHDEDVVKNVDFVKVKPEIGDLVLAIANTRDYHKVLASGSNVSRLTVTSFVGLTSTGELMLWS